MKTKSAAHHSLGFPRLTLGGPEHRRALVGISGVILLTLVGGCSLISSGPQVPSSQLDAEVRNAPRSSFDAPIKKQSAALHSYLLGEIALQKNDEASAITNFSKAKQLFDSPVPTLHHQLSELYLGSQDLPRALVEIEAAIKEDPTNTEYLLSRASLLHTLGRTQDAEAAYRTVIAAAGPHFEPQLFLGLLFIEGKRFKEAAEVLRQAVAERSSDGMANYYLARSLEDAGNLPESMASYNRTLAIEPRNPYALIDLARVLAKLGRGAEIKERCTKLLKADPTQQTAHRILLLLSSSTEAEGLEKLSSVDSTPITLQDAQFRIALNSVRQQDFKAALRYLRLVLASDPSNAEAIYNLAAVLSSTGDVEEAAKELRKIERDSPLFVKSRTFAAFLLRQNKDFSGAERAVREALSVEERDPQVLSFLVVILKEGKKFAEARELLETQLDKTPDDGRMLFSYGSLLHEMGDSEGSLVAMERVIALDPINSDALNFVAFALVKKKEDLPRASRLIEDALRIRPNDGYYLDTLGCIQLQQGNPKEAEATLSRAVQLTAEDPEILEHYADALSQNGKGTDALGLYRRALEKLRDADGDDNSAAIARIEDKVSKIVPGNMVGAPVESAPKKP